jgi:hypothetical protein
MVGRSRKLQLCGSIVESSSLNLRNIKHGQHNSVDNGYKAFAVFGISIAASALFFAIAWIIRSFFRACNGDTP